ncbi:hypothetical protein ACQJBY_009436 [Aegilops geniculata]
MGASACSCSGNDATVLPMDNSVPATCVPPQISISICDVFSSAIEAESRASQIEPTMKLSGRRSSEQSYIELGESDCATVQFSMGTNYLYNVHSYWSFTYQTRRRGAASC